MSAPSDPRSLVFASGNAGKLREIRAILDPLGWAVSPQSEWQVPEAVEDGGTFLENALIKARNAAAVSGLPALGDDSGLVVDALDGRPGIRSSRFAGDNAGDGDNNRKLLALLEEVADERRSAHFYCAVVLMRYPEDPAPFVSTGRWMGRIARQPSGAGGFGYDPLFHVPSEGCTAAELAPEIKNRLSHRASAMRGLIDQLGEFGAQRRPG
jgi:XTP/dITP diphosphohydrolase